MLWEGLDDKVEKYTDRSISLLFMADGKFVTVGMLVLGVWSKSVCKNIMEDREKGTGDYLSALDNDSCCLAPSTICHNVSLCHYIFLC